MSDIHAAGGPPIEPTPDADRPRRTRRRLWWVLGGVVTVAVLAFIAFFIWVKFVHDDAPDEFDADDLAERLETTDSLTPAPGDPVDVSTTLAAPGTGGTAAPTTTTGGAAPAPSSSGWVVGEGSEVGYRIQEVLFGVDAEAAGRTTDVTGSLMFDGTTLTTAEFEVDVATITSDDNRRDNQFRGRIMTVDEFPTASFVLTAPVDVGAEPLDGAEAAVSVTGELTLRGVTNSVTFPLTARIENGRLGVLGQIPVVFADYDIANPSTSGITTEDHGLLEFVLLFDPAQG